MRSDRFITGGALDFMILHQEWRSNEGRRRHRHVLSLPPLCTYREIMAATGKTEKAIRTLFARKRIKPAKYRVVGSRRLAFFDSAPIISYFSDEYHGEGYTPKELAAIIGCSPITICNFCRRGKIKHEKHGRLTTIDRADGDRFAKEYSLVHNVETV